MHAIADTDRLVAEGVITPEAARIIEARARDTMVQLAINAVLCLGILAATFGTIFFLADALAVGLFGSALLAAGLWLLARGAPALSMFGNAAALIGAGMLIGGAGLELADKYPDIAGWAMTAGGALVAALAGRALAFGGLTARFVAGAILLMGLALHLSGLAFLLEQGQLGGAIRAIFFLYAAVLLAAAGWLTNVRLVTALAIVPFAQMLETGTQYFHAAYVFFSPEPVLTILQMGALVALTVWIAARAPERTARHARVLGVLGFIVANLSALVGSLWGDVVGDMLWGPRGWGDEQDYEAWERAREGFEANALVVTEEVFSILWALALAAILFWAAHGGRRGLFNAALTFAAIHAYTQMFESFGDQPLAWAIGGFGAIPLAWGAWRLNRRFAPA